jgi:hypothetical protein
MSLPPNHTRWLKFNFDAASDARENRAGNDVTMLGYDADLLIWGTQH